jgi:hypothetical protein
MPSVLAPPQPTTLVRPRAAHQVRPEKLPWSFITFLKWPARVFNPPKVPEVKGWSSACWLFPCPLPLTLHLSYPDTSHFSRGHAETEASSSAEFEGFRGVPAVRAALVGSGAALTDKHLVSKSLALRTSTLFSGSKNTARSTVPGSRAMQRLTPSWPCRSLVPRLPFSRASPRTSLIWQLLVSIVMLLWRCCQLTFICQKSTTSSPLPTVSPTLRRPYLTRSRPTSRPVSARV